LPQIVFLVLIFLLMYALLVRPQQRRARQQRSLIAALEVGAEVQTVGGIMGRIVSLDDEFIRLEVAPGVVVTFVRGAVARVVEVVADAGTTVPGDLALPDELGLPDDLTLPDDLGSPASGSTTPPPVSPESPPTPPPTSPAPPSAPGPTSKEADQGDTGQQPGSGGPSADPEEKRD
jgi:preprotein translocase subunit YajC